jgi:hypothetical protein
MSRSATETLPDYGCKLLYTGEFRGFRGPERRRRAITIASTANIPDKAGTRAHVDAARS